MPTAIINISQISTMEEMGIVTMGVSATISILSHLALEAVQHLGRTRIIIIIIASRLLRILSALIMVVPLTKVLGMIAFHFFQRLLLTVRSCRWNT